MVALGRREGLWTPQGRDYTTKGAREEEEQDKEGGRAAKQMDNISKDRNLHALNTCTKCMQSLEKPADLLLKSLGRRE